MVLAGVVFLLFVVPTMRGGATPSMAQEEMPPPPPGPDGMDPARDPGMGPGMDPGMDSMGAGMETAVAAVAAVDKPDLPPIEPSNPNPFAAAAAVGTAEELALEEMKVTNYGTNWAQIPITQRFGFPAPEVPPRAAPPPPPSVIGPEKPLRVTSIMWTKDGQALAVYEYGEGDEMQSGVVRPGDVVETWKVSEIRQDYIVVEDRRSGAKTEVYLSEKAPEPKKEEPPAGRPGTRQRPRRPGP